MKKDKTKTLKEIQIKVLLLKKRIKIIKLWSDLDEF